MESGFEGLVVLSWLATIGIYVWAVVVCFQKGKPGFGVLGVVAVALPFLAWFAIVGALRLAKPSSQWARDNYGPEKAAKARGRFPSNAMGSPMPEPVRETPLAAPWAPTPPSFPQVFVPPAEGFDTQPLRQRQFGPFSWAAAAVVATMVGFASVSGALAFLESRDEPVPDASATTTSPPMSSAPVATMEDSSRTTTTTSAGPEPLSPHAIDLLYVSVVRGQSNQLPDVTWVDVWTDDDLIDWGRMFCEIMVKRDGNYRSVAWPAALALSQQYGDSWVEDDLTMVWWASGAAIASYCPEYSDSIGREVAPDIASADQALPAEVH